MTQPYVITVSSEKGGVGKTTIAINLAIFLKALDEDLPVTLLSFDNHFSVDKMFRIGHTTQTGHVGDLFGGVAAEELTETGEFGVQFIPSSRNLNTIRSRISSSMSLARALSECKLEGVVIIDTRPDLDIFTQNAIACADRVIIPVKDTPSLENCRHLFDFADSENIPRQRLKVLPCLIDFRIQYDGTFKNPYQLMKAFAINRGYRCFEEYISKSPKVESLNTNPEGKLFPVLTHGKGTDVHLQFTSLAREMLAEVRTASPRRLSSIAREMEKEHQSRQHAYQERLETLEKNCLLCEEPFAGDAGAAFYVENSTRNLSGFLHEPCVSRMICTYFFKHPSTQAIPAAMQVLLQDSYRRCHFALRRTPGTGGFVVPKINLYRFDENGLEMSHQTISLENLTEADRGFTGLLKRGLSKDDRNSGEPFIVLRKVSNDLPEGILMPEHHRQFVQILEKIASQFPRD